DGQKVQHFKVLQDEMGKYFVWLRKFDSINQLIDYHRRTSISRDSFLLLVDRQPSRLGSVSEGAALRYFFGDWYFSAPAAATAADLS
ncbi:Growth factor receptor-bound protein 2, partial [Taenia solium]